MGFSLEGMFSELNTQLTYLNLVNEDPKKKLDILTESIAWWQNYAVQCGQMKQPTGDNNE